MYSVEVILGFKDALVKDALIQLFYAPALKKLERDFRDCVAAGIFGPGFAGWLGPLPWPGGRIMAGGMFIPSNMEAASLPRRGEGNGGCRRLPPVLPPLAKEPPADRASVSNGPKSSISTPLSHTPAGEEAPLPMVWFLLVQVFFFW